MDIVLEVFDTVFFDRFWAAVYPASSLAAYKENPQHASTPTFSSMREMPTSIQPATKFFQLEPSRYAYLSEWPRDNIYRQGASLFLITWIFGLVLYFICSTLSYYLVFDHDTFTHPKYLKNQVRKEIRQTMQSMPFMSLCTAPLFLLEVRGFGKLYDEPSDAPFALYNILQFPLFICFTDFFIYCIHRCLHHPLFYKRLHKKHHKWIMPTPFASHAFHPLDGFSQSIPYHVFPFLFPLQKFAYVALFVFINIWTVLIHDGEYVANSYVINGAACHTMHHLYFNYNYGQFTTIWDRLGGSYRQPNEELFSRESKMSKDEWERQTLEMEKLQKEVEGDDDRDYGDESRRLQKKVL
ncbi:uncharacterized protein KY384_003695 [Bacidia gigantensis]|uniref:uncharacterized protein n=1 Tax=Bacidia gigantensis TaxID=2732470 RepID=UPI001D046B78|nr:uncharacterized protein KY384_003695 [Bacidia gigantensis]KAG8532058.1 hypothetical protein KY384_003695 [Bacidia gigantensis]